MVQHRRNGYVGRFHVGSPYASMTAHSRSLGGCVYFIRCLDGCIKIGYTKDLAHRRHTLSVEWQAILAVLHGDRDLERAMLRRFQPLLVRGREFFAPGPELLDYVNELRVMMGVPAVAPWTRLVLPPLTPLDE